MPPRQVQKLIHPLLYQQYRLKKGSMEKACASGMATVERVLFHGTTETSSREICLHGFNRSFCGKNGERQAGNQEAEGGMVALVRAHPCATSSSP